MVKSVLLSHSMLMGTQLLSLWIGVEYSGHVCCQGMKPVTNGSRMQWTDEQYKSNDYAIKDLGLMPILTTLWVMWS